MANLGDFDANLVDPATDFEPLPADTYLAIITESEMKPTKSSAGHYLELQFQIIDGPFKGRLLWSRLNLDNQNAKTVRIALAELSAICRATGVMCPHDSSELHNLPLQITVKCKKRSDTGEVVNEIRGYARKAAAVTPPQETSNTPPWVRR